MEQPFDLSDLVSPLEKSINIIEDKLKADRKKLIEQMNRDPVPQFTEEQILTSTTFLQSAFDAMQDFMGEFKKDAVRTMDTETLKQKQEMVRESIRELVLLLGHSSIPFKRDAMLVRFKEAKQGPEIRSRLSSLQDSLQTFGQARWLGQSIVDRDFDKKTKMAIDILAGLLSPTKVGDVDGREVPCGHNQTGYHQDPMRGHYNEHNNQHFTQRKQLSSTPTVPVKSGLKNPLAQLALNGNGTTADYIDLMTRQFQELARIYSEGDRKLSQQQLDLKQQLDSKMKALESFAMVLNRVPESLNAYVLVRLRDVSTQDAAALKQWVTHEEATKVHKMLDTLRDDIVQELALREMEERLKRTSSGQCSEFSTTTMKEYLLVRSMAADDSQGEGSVASEHVSTPVAEEIHEGDGEEGDGECETKGRRSHHQRAREKAFWANMPRTNSSAS